MGKIKLFMLSSMFFFTYSIAEASCDLAKAEIETHIDKIHKLSSDEVKVLDSYSWISDQYKSTRAKSSENDILFLREKIADIESAENNNSPQVCNEIITNIRPTISILQDFIKIEITKAYMVDQNKAKISQRANCINLNIGKCNNYLMDYFKNEFSSFWNIYLLVNYPMYINNYETK